MVQETPESEPADEKSEREKSEMLEPYVAYLRSGLSIDNVKDTQLLSISFTHINPQISEAVANGVANAFIERSFENKTEKYTKSSAWLERSTRELQAQVERADKALADYMREHSIFSVDGKESLTSGKLESLHNQALRAQIDRMLKQSLYEEVRAGNISQLPESFADATITEMQRRQADLVVQASQLSLSYGPLNPKVIEVKQQIEAIQAQIDKGLNALGEKLKADYERALRDEQSLNAALEQAKAEASQQSQLAIQYSVLKQNADTTKAIYTDFLQRTSQAKIQVAEQHNNVRVIQPAKLPRGPIGPDRLSMILASLVASLVGGIGFALLIEYLDRSIKTIEDVVRFTQLPTLGVIPTVPGLLLSNRKNANKKSRKGRKAVSLIAPAEGDPDRLIALDVHSPAAEAYRGLRTSVLLSSAGKPPKTMLVTSGRSGEGKTTTVINTAISLAQLGASVLIIDSDLRKPSVHKVLNITQMQGLSTYLSRDIDIDELIVRTSIMNLSVLPSGLTPPNPAELISSPKMKHLLKLLSERFDHILVDSPPILNLTDSVVLSTLVDGVILVVHGGKSTRDSVRRSCQELVNVGAKNYGVVLNNIDFRREGYDDSYYNTYYYSVIEGTQGTEA